MVHALTVADTTLAMQIQQAALSQEDSDMSQTTWQQQMCAIFQEVGQVPSWRGSSHLRLLDKLILWVQIFSFLIPKLECLHNAALVIVERVAEHAVLRHDLQKEAVLASAWQLLASACHDAEERGKEDSFEYEVREAVQETAAHRHGAEQAQRSIPTYVERAERAEEDAVNRKEVLDLLNQQVIALKMKRGVDELNAAQKKLVNEHRQAELNYNEVTRQAAECREQARKAEADILEHPRLQKEKLLQAERSFEMLWGMSAARIAKVSEAGRAFLAVQRPRMAAEALSEVPKAAMRILNLSQCQPSAELDKDAWVHWRAVWAETTRKCSVKKVLDSAHKDRKSNASLAARCWLLAAEAANYGSAEVSSEDALKAALTCYRDAGNVPPAVTCLTKAWNAKAIAIALSYVVMFSEN
eukprot:gnl/MRDRNA2_/MRDRNA2_79571_c0_seq2.p1 gnl/MRDRNA2_/MRDRNA2_79571_c0~~gnl/MRDRNA2_/MRDRNA2_79571_c0_seq2.p1  ORF type:complete len:413 (+),score=100.03 gnl/MRDRNA2_/MRDRNA2_79571_c0_seq2:20-1258(+)